jgi:hypothetical protein
MRLKSACAAAAAGVFIGAVASPLWAQTTSGSQARAAAAEGLPDRAEIVAGATVLLLQDVAPWGTDSNEQVLAGLGLAFDQAGSRRFALLDLSKYTTIIVASDQTQAFYDAVGPQMPRVNRWLRTGERTLQFHGADRGAQTGQWSFELPRGVTGVHQDYRRLNDVVQPSSPLAAGLPLRMSGTDASHTTLRLGKVDASAVIIAWYGRPTLLDYCYGRGRVIASGQTVEVAYRFFDFGQVLPNMIAASTTLPGCPL